MVAQGLDWHICAGLFMVIQGLEEQCCATVDSFSRVSQGLDGHLGYFAIVTEGLEGLIRTTFQWIGGAHVDGVSMDSENGRLKLW
jgi:hypothetical protein